MQNHMLASTWTDPGGISNWFNNSGIQSVGSSENWKQFLLEDPAIALLAIHTKDATTYHIDTCFTMFIVTLFVISRS